MLFGPTLVLGPGTAKKRHSNKIEENKETPPRANRAVNKAVNLFEPTQIVPRAMPAKVKPPKPAAVNMFEPTQIIGKA